MKVTFVSNYMNHHQQPFSEAMRERLGEDYIFIQTQPMEQERVQMGWDATAVTLPFVRKLWEDEDACKKLIFDSDVVLFGWTGREELIVPRLLAGKLTFRNSERIYKEGQWKAISPRGLLQKYKDFTKYRGAPYYLLCAGGYVASDFALVRSFPDKKLRWGYFPPLQTYADDFVKNKHTRAEKEPVELLWAGRFLAWKHPETAIAIAIALKEKGISFHLTMVGAGELEEKLHAMAQATKLGECVSFTGFMKPHEVRSLMERAQIFLFTSDYEEGWGAVLNEAMNSGCAVVVNHALGAAPFLIENGRNGLVYRNGAVEQCVELVEALVEDAGLCRRLGENAYRTILQIWNAKRAADNLLSVCEELLDAQKKTGGFPKLSELAGLPGDGPASIAPVIKPRKGCL